MEATALYEKRFDHQGTSCVRCGGLLVSEACVDLLDETGEIRFLAWRCVCCGNLIDPVIARNRGYPPVPRRSRVRRSSPVRIG
jgi:hypothetical protein